MTGEDILTVTAAVVPLTQILKGAGLPTKFAAGAVITLSLFGVLFWGWSGNVLSREMSWSLFAGWTLIATSAAGVFGFIREGAATVTAMRKASNGGG
mgnify:FL=1